MNKLTKGAIAGGAGIVLLLGGAGTFALWNDSATIDGGTITAGTLDIQTVTPGAWTDISPDVDGQPVPIPDITDFRTVPGDVLKYTAGVTIVATGNNLLAEFGYVLDDELPPLPDDIDVTVAVLKNGVPATNPVSFAPADVFTVEVTFDFDFTETDQNDLQQDVWDLSSLELTVTQVRPELP